MAFAAAPRRARSAPASRDGGWRPPSMRGAQQPPLLDRRIGLIGMPRSRHQGKSLASMPRRRKLYSTWLLAQAVPPGSATSSSMSSTSKLLTPQKRIAPDASSASKPSSVSSQRGARANAADRGRCGRSCSRFRLRLQAAMVSGFRRVFRQHLADEKHSSRRPAQPRRPPLQRRHCRTSRRCRSASCRDRARA